MRRRRGCVVIGPDEPVTIGYMLATSGAVAFLGEDSLGGIELALDARGNKLLGREIELLGEDSLCTPEGGQTAAENLVADERCWGSSGPAVPARPSPPCRSSAAPATS
ncbi:MAG: ABC transporter substrate-binding protein [Anaerolineaceae bacterium]|nr:ABC transporter substrate-binding protein [Anaerolineaceae bacterium]MDE0329799.1 ABC transporter substrate-binding protein [Anaerolineaceae bacterium]